MNKEEKYCISRYPDWILNTIFYQIFPERYYNGDLSNDPQNIKDWGDLPNRESFFGGDLPGIIKKIGYLEALGINCIYLTPIFESPSNHKYDTTDYYTVDTCFGNKDILQSLVKELHKRNIRIILDGVFNHCSNRHPFFKDIIQKGKNSRYWDWFIIHEYPITQFPEPNYQCFAGYGIMPEFNQQNTTVQKYFQDVVRYWILETDIDGWRLDVVEFMDPAFIKKLYEAVKSVKKDSYVLGEVMGNATSWFKSGCIDGIMNYLLRKIIINFFIKNKLNAKNFDEKLYELRRFYPHYANFVNYNLIGSHDTPRFLTLCNGNIDLLKLVLVFLFTYIGVPAIYYGDEVGMEGEGDPDCRRPMVWDKSKQNEDLLTFYKKLIKIRKENKVLSRGNFRGIFFEKNVYAFMRELDKEAIIVVLNNSSDPTKLNISLPLPAKKYLTTDLFWGNTFCVKSSLEVELDKYGFKILKFIF